jgi:hypothetical protein
MTVELSGTRKAYVLDYDQSVVLGDKADLTATNPDGGDVSNRRDFNNDGHAIVTFPIDYEGSAAVEIVGSDGGADVGTITVS